MTLDFLAYLIKKHVEKKSRDGKKLTLSKSCKIKVNFVPLVLFHKTKVLEY